MAVRTGFVVAALLMLPTAFAVPFPAPVESEAPGVPAPVRPAHHGGGEVPSREYNWTALEDENASGNAPVVVENVAGSAEAPFVIEGYIYHGKGRECFTGITVRNSAYVVIRNNEFYWTCYGIYVTGSSNVVIEDNYFQDTPIFPVLVDRSTDVAYRENIVQSIHLMWDAPISWGPLHPDPTRFLGVQNLIIENNRFQLSGLSVFAYDPFGAVIRSTNVLVSSNIVEDAAIGLSFTDGGRVTRNLVQGFKSWAIDIGWNTDTMVDNNTIFNYAQRWRGLGLTSRGWDGVIVVEGDATLRHNDFWGHVYRYASANPLFPVFFGDAVRNEGDGIVDAAHNWWGSPLGPGIPPGGAIRGAINYEPWSILPNHPPPPPPEVMPLNPTHVPPPPSLNDPV